MSVPDISLSKDDLAQSQWEAVISGCTKKVCLDYSQAFWNKAQEVENSDDNKNQAIFTLLTAVTNQEIDSSSDDTPFRNTTVIDNITDEYLNALREWAPEISDPELRARVTDILWFRRRDPRNDYKMAQLAVTSYLDSARVLEDPDRWDRFFKRVERAICLSRKINYRFSTVINYIETTLDKYNGEDTSFMSAKLMELLQKHKQGDPTKYAALAEKAALRAEAEQNWHKARSYWEIKVGWHNKGSEYERATWLNLCETYVKEAEAAINSPSPSYTAASTHLQKAIEAFRKTSDTQERVEQINKLLVKYQSESLKEMVSFSQRMDASLFAAQARDQVKEKEIHDAIFTLALLGSSPDVNRLRNEVKKLSRNHISYLFSTTLTNEMGKTVAKQPSLLSNDPDEVERAIKFEMYRQAVFLQEGQAQAIIEHARYQINLEHNVRVDDFLSLVFNSPFVPPKREYTYARGLHAGMTGDFLSSTHFLIPQIENSVRYILYQRGFIPSGIDDNGIQNEHNLNTTLYRPEIKTIFDENTLFDLRGLLVEHSGSNLRNRMAHGLISHNEFYRPLTSYLWWLTLRLCCLPLLAVMQKTQDSSSKARSSDSTETREGNQDGNSQ